MGNLEEIRQKGVPIELGGKTRHIKFDFNAYAELEEEYGSIDDAMDALMGKIIYDENGKEIPTVGEDGKVMTDKRGNPIPKREEKVSIRAIRFLLWAGLVWEDEHLTERQVGSMLDFSNVTAVSDAVRKAIAATVPNLSEEEETEAITKVVEAKKEPDPGLQQK